MRTPLPANQSRKPLDLEGVSWRLGVSQAYPEITWNGQVVGHVREAKEVRSHGARGRVTLRAYEAEVVILAARLVVVAPTHQQMVKALALKVEEHIRLNVPRAEWPPLLLQADWREMREIRAGDRDILRYPAAARYSIANCWHRRPVEIRCGADRLVTSIDGIPGKQIAKQAFSVSPRLRARYPKMGDYDSFAAIFLDLETLQVPAGVSPGGEAQTAG